MSNPYAKYFEQKRVFGMLHLKGESIPQVLECLKKEFDEYVKGGIDGVVVENYYNGCDEIIAALDYLHDQIGSQTLIGVNCLRSESMGLELASAYKTDFVQLDSVVGHVIPRDDATLTHFFKIWQEKYTGMILGGVRFKNNLYYLRIRYQKILKLLNHAVMRFVLLKQLQVKKLIWIRSSLLEKA